MEKTCSKCLVPKDLGEFYRRPGSPDGRRSECAQCLKARAGERYHSTQDIQKKRRARYNSDNHRAWRLRTAYGMTPENYDALLAHQGGVCAVCKQNRPDILGRRMNVDHDHATGGVRGILCHACNLMLGLLESCANRAGLDVQSAGQQIAEYLAGPQYAATLPGSSARS